MLRVISFGLSFFIRERWTIDACSSLYWNYLIRFAISVYSLFYFEFFFFSSFRSLLMNLSLIHLVFFGLSRYERRVLALFLSSLNKTKHWNRTEKRRNKNINAENTITDTFIVFVYYFYYSGTTSFSSSSAVSLRLCHGTRFQRDYILRARSMTQPQHRSRRSRRRCRSILLCQLKISRCVYSP